MCTILKKNIIKTLYFSIKSYILIGNVLFCLQYLYYFYLGKESCAYCFLFDVHRVTFLDSLHR